MLWTTLALDGALLGGSDEREKAMGSERKKALATHDFSVWRLRR